MPPNIHILGIQGSGKGTQSSLLVDKYDFSYASSGDLFRQRAQVEDDFGRLLREQLTTGHLLDNSYLFQAVSDYLDTADLRRGFLGDGVIRTVEQYEGLEPHWFRHDLGEPLLIHLILSEEVALQRIAHRQEEQQDPAKQPFLYKYGGKALKRTDDNPAAIQERFRLFHKMTEPVIDVFDAEGRCVHIDANQGVADIHLEVCKAIDIFYPATSHVPDKE